ncbi:MAG: hypothetical protein J0I19_00815 [Alphaproteobacteria bacterium]|nr:hypothetical protein [Alphaproteobacteria bacterium]
MVTAALVALLMLGLGYAQVRTQQKLRKDVAALPPDAQWRMRVVFPAVMGGILVLVFIAIFLLRPHA